MATRTRLHTIAAGQGNTYITSLAFSPDGRILASSTVKQSSDGTVVLWDARRVQKLGRVR